MQPTRSRSSRKGFSPISSLRRRLHPRGRVLRIAIGGASVSRRRLPADSGVVEALRAQASIPTDLPGITHTGSGIPGDPSLRLIGTKTEVMASCWREVVPGRSAPLKSCLGCRGERAEALRRRARQRPLSIRARRTRSSNRWAIAHGTASRPLLAVRRPHATPSVWIGSAVYERRHQRPGR